MQIALSAEDQRLLLAAARESIASSLENRRPLFPDPPASVLAPCGAFVTLRISDRLRGCIGKILATAPLFDVVIAMAVSSAFEDPRFPPLSRDELAATAIEISALSPLSDSSAGEIRPGLHGIFVQQGRRSGLLLPQVAIEQGWDRETFLTHTCIKAGLPGDAWRMPDLEIRTFTAVVFGENR